MFASSQSSNLPFMTHCCISYHQPSISGLRTAVITNMYRSAQVFICVGLLFELKIQTEQGPTHQNFAPLLLVVKNSRGYL